MYSEKDYLVIPILIFHGQQKEWRNPLRFQDSLQEMPPVVYQVFGENILDFTCKLLNLQEDGIRLK